MTQERFNKGLQVLTDNGIEPDEAPTVLQALCYVLLDEKTDEFMNYNKDQCEICGYSHLESRPFGKHQICVCCEAHLDEEQLAEKLNMEIIEYDISCFERSLFVACDCEDKNAVYRILDKAYDHWNEGTPDVENLCCEEYMLMCVKNSGRKVKWLKCKEEEEQMAYLTERDLDLFLKWLPWHDIERRLNDGIDRTKEEHDKCLQWIVEYATANQLSIKEMDDLCFSDSAWVFEQIFG